MQQEILSAIRSSGFSFRRLSDRCPGLRALKNVPQDPSYHGEGDVYAHTEMVCERLLELDAWSSLPRDEQDRKSVV